MRCCALRNRRTRLSNGPGFVRPIRPAARPFPGRGRRAGCRRRGPKIGDRCPDRLAGRSGPTIADRSAPNRAFRSESHAGRRARQRPRRDLISVPRPAMFVATVTRFCLPGVGDDFGFDGDLVGVEHLMLDAGLGQQSRQNFRFVDRRGCRSDRPAGGMDLDDFVARSPSLLGVRRAEDLLGNRWRMAGRLVGIGTTRSR